MTDPDLEHAAHDDGRTVDRTEDPADDHLSRIALAVGSDQTVVWTKRIVLGAALAFLVGAIGYYVGVATTTPPGNDVDRGFLVDMTDHHDQAVGMAQRELANGSDPTAKAFAMEVIMFQRQELGRLFNFKQDLGVTDPDYDLDRQTMAWMDMPTPLRAMPGMASADELARLDAARGTEADLLFLELMQRHHSGGAHMADHAAEHGANPDIRELAARMARNQRIEVKEYQGLIDKLRAAGQ